MIETDAWMLGGLAAVLIFWMVGAHNRMTALRNAVHALWPAVEDSLQRRGQALARLADVLRPILPSERAALEAVVAAVGQVRAATAAVHQRPSRRDAVAGLGAAEAALAPALARLVAIAEHDAGARSLSEVVELTQRLHDLEPRLAFARQAFNEAVQVYNAAVGQFPTSLLAPLLRLRRAGTL